MKVKLKSIPQFSCGVKILRDTGGEENYKIKNQTELNSLTFSSFWPASTKIIMHSNLNKFKKKFAILFVFQNI